MTSRDGNLNNQPENILVTPTTVKETRLIAPYGGALKNLFVPPEEISDFKSYAIALPSLQLSARALCDLEMLATGAFSPLEGFMNRADYARVVDEMRLAEPSRFPDSGDACRSMRKAESAKIRKSPCATRKIICWR